MLRVSQSPNLATGATFFVHQYPASFLFDGFPKLDLSAFEGFEGRPWKCLRSARGFSQVLARLLVGSAGSQEGSPAKGSFRGFFSPIAPSGGSRSWGERKELN